MTSMARAGACSKQVRARSGNRSASASSLQRHHIDNISAAKTAETRQRRIDKTISLFQQGKKR